MQVCTGVGPVRFWLQVIVVQLLPAFGDCGVHVGTAAEPVLLPQVVWV